MNTIEGNVEKTYLSILSINNARISILQEILGYCIAELRKHGHETNVTHCLSCEAIGLAEAALISTSRPNPIKTTEGEPGSILSEINEFADLIGKPRIEMKV